MCDDEPEEKTMSEITLHDRQTHKIQRTEKHDERVLWQKSRSWLPAQEAMMTSPPPSCTWSLRIEVHPLGTGDPWKSPSEEFRRSCLHLKTLCLCVWSVFSVDHIAAHSQTHTHWSRWSFMYWLSPYTHWLTDSLITDSLTHVQSAIVSDWNTHISALNGSMNNKPTHTHNPHVFFCAHTQAPSSAEAFPTNLFSQYTRIQRRIRLSCFPWAEETLFSLSPQLKPSHHPLITRTERESN